MKELAGELHVPYPIVRLAAVGLRLTPRKRYIRSELEAKLREILPEGKYVSEGNIERRHGEVKRRTIVGMVKTVRVIAGVRMYLQDDYEAALGAYEALRRAGTRWGPWPEGYVSISAAAKIAGVTAPAMYLAIKKGKVRTMTCGDQRFVKKEEAEAYRPVRRKVAV